MTSATPPVRTVPPSAQGGERPPASETGVASCGGRHGPAIWAGSHRAASFPAPVALPPTVSPVAITSALRGQWGSAWAGAEPQPWARLGPVILTHTQSRPHDGGSPPTPLYACSSRGHSVVSYRAKYW